MPTDSLRHDPDTLIPASSRLLHGVRNALADVVAVSDDPATHYLMGAADAALNELMLRENTAFYADVYRRLRALVSEGIAAYPSLLPQPQHDAIAGTLSTLPQTPHPDAGYRALSAMLRSLLDCAVTLVAAAAASTDPAVHAWRSKLLATERELHDYGAGQAPRPAMPAEKPRPFPTRDDIEAYLRRRFPERNDLKVTSFRRLVGGFQKLTILFETEDRAGGKQSLVMRAEKDERFMKHSASDIRDEFRIVQAVHAAGVPSAEPLWLESDIEQLGRRFLVSRRVFGENYGSAVTTSKTMTDAALHSFIDALVRIHRIPLRTAMDITGYLGPAQPTIADLARDNVDTWRLQPYMPLANPSPLLERILSWLHANAPRDTATPCLIHRDYGPHNILVNDERVSAVLDWEAGIVGDPAEDLSYFIQCTAAQVDRQRAIDLYQEISGVRISDFRLRYYDVFNLIKIVIGSLSSGAMYQAEPEAGIDWNLLTFKYVSVVAGTIEDKIALAESVRDRN